MVGHGVYGMLTQDRDPGGVGTDHGPRSPGRALRHLRQRAGLSMADLAWALECTVAELSAIETECIFPLSSDPPTREIGTLNGPSVARVRWRYETEGSARAEGGG